MAVKRYRPSVGSTSGTIYRIQKATTTAGYDPEVAVLGQDACAFYSTNSVTLTYHAITDIPTDTISRISIVYRACCTTGGYRSGAIQLLNNDTGISAATIDLGQYSDTNSYLNNAANCTTYDVPDGAWDLILNGSWSIRVQGRSTNTTLFTIICVDIEYEEPTDFRIGANKLKKALLGNNIIDRIYKGSFLLFQYDDFPETLGKLKYIQSQWYPLTYIDTGVAWNNSTKIEAEIVTISTGSNGNKLFVATQGDSSMPGFTYLYIDTSDQVIGSNVTVSNYTVGTDTVTATYSSSTSSNIYITAWSDVYWACTFRYKNIKIYNGDTLLRDYIPCYRKSDEIAGLYDKVSKVFYTSDGSSEYLKGPDAEITLPEAYQEVEYVTFHGNNSGTSSTEYIDTGVVPSATKGFFLDADMTGASGCTGWGSGADRAATIFRGYSTDCRIQADNVSAAKTYQAAGRHVWIIDYYNQKMGYDSTLDSISPAQYGVLNFYLGSWYEAGTTYYGMGGNVYSFKIHDGENLLVNYVPCYRKSDSVIGFYDTVNNVFKVNNGGGTFTKGPDVT